MQEYFNSLFSVLSVSSTCRQRAVLAEPRRKTAYQTAEKKKPKQNHQQQNKPSHHTGQFMSVASPL